MEDKKSFVLYTDYLEHIETLSAEEQGALFVAILRYEQGEELPALSPAAKMAFSFIRAQLDRDAEKYEEEKQRRSEAGKKGGAPKGNSNASKTTETSKNKQKQAKTTKNNQKQPKQAKQADNDTVTVNDNVIDITPFGGLRGDLTSYSDILQAKVSEWLSYKKERKQEYKPTGFIALMNKIDASVKKHGEKKVIELIDYSIVNQYQGIIWDRLERAAPKKDATYLSRAYKDGEQRDIIGDVLGDG